MMDPKKKAVLDRIKRLEEAITKGSEYLESGKHAHWNGFRPLFASKRRVGTNCRRTEIGSKTCFSHIWKRHCAGQRKSSKGSLRWGCEEKRVPLS